MLLTFCLVPKIFILFKFFKKIFNVYFAFIYACLMCLEWSEARKEVLDWIPWHWNKGSLWATTWLLGTKSGSSASQSVLLNSKLFPLPQVNYSYKWNIKFFLLEIDEEITCLAPWHVGILDVANWKYPCSKKKLALYFHTIYFPQINCIRLYKKSHGCTVLYWFFQNGF